MIGQQQIAQAVVPIISGEAAIFHCRLELGIEWTVIKQTLLDFSFSLSNKQKIDAAEENEKEMVSSLEDNSWLAEDVLFCASLLILPV